ncbi:DUF3298 and DUF4163 domain-containing protein [Novosphingobium profundi]|uniref:DUF4163 domain-containing protein n=1 Tax=Novosphingobium profundi TaxID=1774954 RepID=UPI001BD95330|nr:DUF4163 domain-containing protein [Novosphingobium profundi]MBT0669884.1 DUF3298 and DUF4163 domain-containing protein [Novosphingobium profundi]
MRIFLVSSAVAGLALLVSGCSDKAPSQSASPSASGAQDTRVPSAPDANAPSEAPSAEASEAPPADLSVDVSNDTYEFQFAYPAKAAAIPGLRSWFETRRRTARKELEASASQDKQAAAAQDFPYHAHVYSADWQVVTDLPEWLSLSSEIYTYTGGAHGMSSFDGRLWNRGTDAMLKAADLFTSEDAFSSAVRARFCKALDAQRVKRRGAALVPGDIFSECIEPARQTVLLGSSNGKTFDRIGFEIAPYEAGPYAEGSYEITLPVDAAVMRALKPQYRNSFSIPG